MHYNKILTVLFTTLFAFACHGVNANSHHGDATWYTPGLGSCGEENTESQYVVALSLEENSGHHRCHQHITIHYHGRSVRALVVDSCPGCSRYSLDLSPAAFEALAPLGVGRIKVNWNYSS